MSKIKSLVPGTVNEFDEIDFEETPIAAHAVKTYSPGV